MNALTFDLLLCDHVTKLESEAGSKLTVDHEGQGQAGSKPTFDHEGHGPITRVRSKYQRYPEYGDPKLPADGGSEPVLAGGCGSGVVLLVSIYFVPTVMAKVVSSNAFLHFYRSETDFFLKMCGFGSARNPQCSVICSQNHSRPKNYSKTVKIMHSAFKVLTDTARKKVLRIRDIIFRNFTVVPEPEGTVLFPVFFRQFFPYHMVTLLVRCMP